MAPPNHHLETVLGYAQRGWHVFPCHSAPAGICSCGKTPCGTDNGRAGKHPRTVNGVKAATTELQQIQDWFSKWPGCNWAVATGKVSGVFVLDVDGKQGRASLAALESQHEPLPVTLTSTTGRGEHRWFRYADTRVIQNSAGTRLGAGLDVRSIGGHVIVPPSIHQSGTMYQWQGPDAPIANPPLYLLELIIGSGSSRIRSGYSQIPVGQRLSTLRRIAGAMLGRGEKLEVIEAELLQVNAQFTEPHEHSRVQAFVADFCSRYPSGPIRMEDTQPLQEFLRIASQKNNLEFLGRNRNAKWSSPLFAFTRMVKGRPEFFKLDASPAASRIEQETGVEFWECFTDVCADPRMQFISEWNAVRSPAGSGDWLTRALAEAQRSPVVLENPYSSKFAQVISLLVAMQRIMGEGKPFIAPQRRIAELIGVDYSMVGKYLRFAEPYGLSPSAGGRYIPRQTAKEYIFSLSMLNRPSADHSYQSDQTHQDPPRRTTTVTGASSDSGKNESLEQAEAHIERGSNPPLPADEGHSEYDSEAAALSDGLEWAETVWDEGCELSPESLAREAAMASLSQGCSERGDKSTAGG